MKVRRHFYFSGMVQGVGFRYRAHCGAEGLGLTGWVRNLPDDRVEMEVQGEEAAIGELLSQLENGHFIHITDIEEKDLALCKSENRFRVLGY